MYRLVTGLVLTLFAAVTASADSSERPNVLLILADDLGFSDLGSYGGEMPTPHLDRLAAGGARFSDFYTSARCCPSRASLMTGLHPHQAGIGSFATRQPRQGAGPAYTGRLLPTCVTMAEVLGSAGYSTWMVGKWHIEEPGPIAHGFEQFYGYVLGYAADQWDPASNVRLPEGTAEELSYAEGEYYATDAFNDYALEFLRQAREGTREDGDDAKPWFLYLAHSSPHFPVQAPKASVDRHFERYLTGWDELRAARLERQKALGLVGPDHSLPPRSSVPIDKDEITNGFSGEENPAWDSLPEDRRRDLARRMATFAAMVEHVDDGVGRLLADLEANGELDNTLILFLSDNGACYEWGPFGFDGPSRRGTTTLYEGEALDSVGQAGSWSSYGSAWANLGNTPLSKYKHFCHEGGIASPLLVHWPAGFRPVERWIRDPAHLMDLMPTVLEATGAIYPETWDGNDITPMEGLSLLPAIRGEALPERALAFEHQDARGLRRGEWKLAWGKRQKEPITWELYNLETDRSEQHDLAAEMPDLVSSLAADWEAWARRVGAAPFHRTEESAAAVGGGGDRDSPQVADKPLVISATVDVPDAAAARGVVLAQGGDRHGYALHFLEGGIPAFDVRVAGEVVRLQGEAAVSGTVKLVGELHENVIRLRVNEGEVVETKSPGLIPAQPTDALSIGVDERTAAGDYPPQNRLQGATVQGAEVKAVVEDRRQVDPRCESEPRDRDQRVGC